MNDRQADHARTILSHNTAELVEECLLVADELAQSPFEAVNLQLSSFWKGDKD